MSAYDHDSFFTLSLAGRTGLAAVSFALAVVWLAAVARVSRGRGRGVRVMLALAAFWLFEWVSPQVYYLYYMVLLDVPAQVVVGAPPGPRSLAALLTFTGPATLSAHTRGVLGLMLIGIAVLGGRKYSPGSGKG